MTARWKTLLQLLNMNPTPDDEHVKHTYRIRRRKPEAHTPLIVDAVVNKVVKAVLATWPYIFGVSAAVLGATIGMWLG